MNEYIKKDAIKEINICLSAIVDFTEEEKELFLVRDSLKQNLEILKRYKNH